MANYNPEPQWPVKKKHKRSKKLYLWQTANSFDPPPPAASPSPYDGDTELESKADSSVDEAGSTTAQQPMRTIGMNSYGAQQQPIRQTPRLQNTNKTGLGGTSSGWGGFGMPAAGGFGGLGAAPGLGQPRPQQLSGFAQVMGGGSGQGPIDMSDFPSLSGGPRPQQNNAAAPGWNSSAIRQPSAQPHQQPQPSQARAPSAAPSQQSLDQFDGQRSQQPPIERSGGGDDFPPLGGQLNGDGFGQVNGVSSVVGSGDAQQPRINGQQTQVPLRESSNNIYHQSQQTPVPQPSQSLPLQNGQPPPPAASVKKYADMTEDEKWGLQGLMAAFEARRQAESGGVVDDTLPPALRSAVIMGHDLSTLGLDLDSLEPLYPTFTPFQAVGSSNSTFDFHERHMVPDFTLPNAYTVSNVPSITARMSAFSEETLFSIFYQNPRDMLQERAAAELMQREWRWHKLLRQWLQKDTREASTSSSLPLVDLTNGTPVGTQPIRTSERGEKGVYVFFDAMNWRRERRVLELDYDHLDPVRLAIMGNGVHPANGAPARVMSEVGGVGQGSGQGSSQIPGA